MCKLSATPSDCATFDCSADPYGYAIYPADSSFFASCAPGEDPLVLRCPLNHIYQPSEYKCVSQSFMNFDEILIFSWEFREN